METELDKLVKTRKEMVETLQILINQAQTLIDTLKEEWPSGS